MYRLLGLIGKVCMFAWIDAFFSQIASKAYHQLIYDFILIWLDSLKTLESNH